MRKKVDTSKDGDLKWVRAQIQGEKILSILESGQEPFVKLPVGIGKTTSIVSLVQAGLKK